MLGHTLKRKSYSRIFACHAAAGLLGLALLLAPSLTDIAGAKPKKMPLPDPNPKRVAAAKANGGATTADPEQPAQPPEFDYKAALKPILEYKLGKGDRANLKSAISQVYKQRYANASSAMNKIKDKDARKVAHWYFFRSRGLGAKAADIEAFRKANPHWPSQDRMRQNAERALFMQKADAETVRAFFVRSSPETGAGRAALAEMHIREGAEARGHQMIRKAWSSHPLTKEIETEFLKRYSKVLTPEDHKARVDRLLFKDRKAHIGRALRTAELLSAEEQKKIKARIEVVKRSKKAKELLEAIPEETAKDDVGIYFSRIQWLRRQDRDQEAWTMLRNVPNEPHKLLDLGEWWVERRVNCRAALNSGNPKIAYEIASNHGPLSGRHYREAEFLAGWIALRFLNTPDIALKHFLALRTAALSPKQIARAEYWLGRAADATGDRELAVRHYTAGSQHTLTYYGQLSLQALTGGITSLRIEPAPEPTEEDIKRFLERDAVKAIGVVRAAGFERLATLFFHQLARTLESPAEVVLLAELAKEVGQPYASVRLGKIALNRGLPVAEHAYPVGMLPEYKEINGTVEAAFLHALSRQESEFNPKAKSPVGARGLMQLMPRTARAVARQHKVRYRRSKLTSDPSYNMMLGVAHLRDLLDSYSGSYILSLVAYNAGGGRVRDWTEQFGDPRDPGTDPIDWVERIPFTETRNYVQKILTTMQIFRSRLEGPEKALRLSEDLHRNDRKAQSGEAGETAVPATPATTQASN